jgi:hypothetical protein
MGPTGARHQDELADWPSAAIWLEPELASLHCKLQTRPLVREGSLHEKEESDCHSKKCKIWSPDPKAARHQDELADWPSAAIWPEPELASLHCKLQNRPLVREGSLHEKEESNCHSKKCKISSPDPKAARHQDELADRPSVAIWLELELVRKDRQLKTASVELRPNMCSGASKIELVVHCKSSRCGFGAGIVRGTQEGEHPSLEICTRGLVWDSRLSACVVKCKL